MSALVGISGARRNACAAICVDGKILAACEQERVTRQRGVGLWASPMPPLAVNEVVALSRCRPDDVSAYVVAEAGVTLSAASPTVVVDHHEAHAATAFLTSPFERAAVLVCDGHPDRELSVWLGEGPRVVDTGWRWRGPAFATLYADCARVIGASRHAHAHELEMLAHRGTGDSSARLRDVFRYTGQGLAIDESWQARIEGLIRSDPGHRGQTAAASGVQRRLGELLLELIADIRAQIGADALCLGGGLFYNTYFNTLIRSSGVFADTFIPINPGNSGLAVGASLLVSAKESGVRPAADLSPFLGPEYDLETIKATLDGCKLSYEFVSESDAIDIAASALCRGELVAWFHGRMEWGHRALGHRTILANPRSRYVLDNLNDFLRKRDRSRPFGVAACADSAGDMFCGPKVSRFMEYEYRPRDDRFRHVMPTGATSIRVQTVAPEVGPLWQLLKHLEHTTDTGALVNTSFNGFHEPIVCSPADAVRVFYGTGLDMLVLDRFILRK
jgi:carbamoyltransferase